MTKGRAIGPNRSEALATYEEAKIQNIGAYEKGSNPEIDNSIKSIRIMEFLRGVDDHIHDEALDEFEAVIKAVVDVEVRG